MNQEFLVLPKREWKIIKALMLGIVTTTIIILTDMSFTHVVKKIENLI